MSIAAKNPDRALLSRARGIIALAVVVFSLLGAWIGEAFEFKDAMAFSVGPVVVRPLLAVSESYNDNIFYSATDQQSAFITAVVPGVDFRLGRPDADRVFHLLYNFNQLWYHGVTNIDTAHAHNLSLTGTIKGDRLTSDTSLALSSMNTIYGGYEAFTEGALFASRNIERTTYKVGESVSYRTSEKTSAYGRFTMTDLDFAEQGFYFDQNVWRVLGGFGYQLRPKVRLLGEVYTGQSANDPNIPYSAYAAQNPTNFAYAAYIYTVKPAHLETVGGTIGADVTLATKLTGTFKVGYEQSNREEWRGGDPFGGLPDEAKPPLGTPVLVGAEAIDLGAPVANVSLTAALGDRTSATLGYNRRTTASVQTTATISTSDAFTLSLRHVLGTTHPWFFDVGMNYGLRQYEPLTGIYAIYGGPEVRSAQSGYRSDFVGANASVAYQFRPWLGASIGYRYSSQNSSRNDRSYENTVNEVYLAISMGYRQ